MIALSIMPMGKLPTANTVVLEASAPHGFESVGDFHFIFMHTSCPQNKMSCP